MIDFFINAFNLILYQPLLNVLVLLYEYLPGHDFGVAVIVLTFLTRVVLHPLVAQSVRSQKTLGNLQPKISEIQKKYKDDKEKQVRATMELYQKEKVNPFSGCLPLLIQMPLLIALYRVFWKGLAPEEMSFLYGFVPNPGQIDPNFLGIINLSKPNGILAFIAGISQFFQSRMMLPKTQKTERKTGFQFGDVMQKQMLYFFPAFTILILWNFPSAIGLYWATSTIFSIIQQYFILKNYPS
jgi:YidC/Oxa1 family membrane protein insertase